jgi:hypothetical protein
VVVALVPLLHHLHTPPPLDLWVVVRLLNIYYNNGEQEDHGIPHVPNLAESGRDLDLDEDSGRGEDYHAVGREVHSASVSGE